MSAKTTFLGAAGIGMMLAATGLLVLLKVLGVGPAAGWGWWVVWSPIWFSWLIGALAASLLMFGMACDRGMQWLTDWAHQSR